MDRPTTVADYSMLTLAVVLGAGSVILFATVQSTHVLSLGWPDRYVLPWDGLLSLAFFVQHSAMIRRPVRARLATVVPGRYQGALYAIASGIVLALVVVLWQPSGTRLLVLEGISRLVARALAILALAILALSAYALRRSFDPLGLAPIRAHLHGCAHHPAGPVFHGPYLWVRHPVYSCIVLLFWTNPDWTADQLLLSLMWTAWIWVAARLEERDLVAEFGDAYRAYQRRVPMLVPWRGRVALAP